MCEKAYDTQMKKDLVSIQGFYNPNVSLSLLVEHVYYHTDILSGKIKLSAKSLMTCLAYKVGYSCS